MSELCPLLLRQLKRLGLNQHCPPTNQEEWNAFLEKISRTYEDDDQERYLFERSVMISSQEMHERSMLISAQRENLVAAAKMSALGEMAGGIAHEINNPLTIIIARINQINRVLNSDEIDKNKLKAELAKILTTTKRIANIIRGMKSISRNASDDPKVKINIKNVIEDTLVLCQEQFKIHSIQLRLELDVSDEAAIAGNSTQLSQVLLNLLNNAHDAVLPLTEKWICLNVSQTESESEFVIRVTDSGNGIPGQIISKIMAPFFTTKEVGKGTGLGLSISKGIIEAHNGQIYYDKNSTRTSFVIKIPSYCYG